MHASCLRSRAWCRSAAWPWPRLLLVTFQRPHFVREVVDVAEVAIHRREADVGDLIEFLQLRHHQRAELAAGDLALRPIVEDLLGAIGNVVDIRRLDRALFARLQQSRDQLRSLEALARAVLLHYHVRNFFDALVAREPFAAAVVETLPAAADHVALAALARVHDLVADITAE